MLYIKMCVCDNTNKIISCRSKELFYGTVWNIIHKDLHVKAYKTRRNP